MGCGEAEISHGFADDDVALYGQDDQGPQGNLACGMERKRERTVVVRASLGLISSLHGLTVAAKSRGN